MKGKQKTKKALAVSAGFKIFIPVPPNTSLPITTANTTDIASIQRGTSTGIIRGINIPETKYPSLTECPLEIAKANSTPSPTAYETIKRGRNFQKPKITFSNNEASIDKAL